MPKDEDLVECGLCGCHFSCYNDYKRHMDTFGVEGHIERLRAAHWALLHH